MSRMHTCKICGEDVLLNGIGSSRNKLQRALTATLQFIIPFTANKFKEASNKHDLAVHKASNSGWMPYWYKLVDAEFRDDCLRAAKKSNWFGRIYYKKQAYALYEALVFNNGDGYPDKPCNME